MTEVEKLELTVFLSCMGYTDIRLMPNGQWIGTLLQFFTTGLFVGLHEGGYATRYCYEHYEDAAAAAEAWDGAGDPPGPWIKHKGGKDGDRLGPGAVKTT